MEKIRLERTFHATPERLWELIADTDHYRAWTAVFSEGSDFVGDWSEGSKMLFVADDSSGIEGGLLQQCKL